MRSHLMKASLAAALVVGLPGIARADSPDLSAFSTATQFFALGGSTFDVQFLFGRQGLSSSLFFKTDGFNGGGDNGWTRILSTVGNFPGATQTPAPGTVFNNGGPGYTVQGAGSQTVLFAICNAPAVLFSNCTASSTFMTTSNATPSTNVRTLTSAQWNAVAPAMPNGSTTSRNTVFGFEDLPLPVSDRDYNDVVFSTNLSVVPEPSSILLMSAGLLGLAAAARARSKKA